MNGWRWRLSRYVILVMHILIISVIEPCDILWSWLYIITIFPAKLGYVQKTHIHITVYRFLLLFFFWCCTYKQKWNYMICFLLSHIVNMIKEIFISSIFLMKYIILEWWNCVKFINSLIAFLFFIYDCYFCTLFWFFILLL